MTHPLPTGFLTPVAVMLMLHAAGCADDGGCSTDLDCKGDRICVASACTHPDAGMTDAGMTDAGMTDAGMTDAGAADADTDQDAALDAGRDADVDGGADGAVDAGTDAAIDSGTDGGVPEDAGTSTTTDAGLPSDAGLPPDSGLPADSGLGDGGTPADSGPPADGGVSSDASVVNRFESYLKASTVDPRVLGDTGEHFGWWVSLDGDTLLVGAPLEDSCATGANGDETNNGCEDSGAAYIFRHTQNGWTQEAYLKPSTPAVEGRFGSLLDLSGDVAVIGSRQSTQSTQAFIFRRTGATWTEEQVLTYSESLDSLAIHGDTVIAGSDRDENCNGGINPQPSGSTCSLAGAAWVHRWNGTSWSQEAYLKPSVTYQLHQVGVSVAIWNDLAVVGSEGDRSCGAGVNPDPTGTGCHAAGAAFVFRRSGTSWAQEAYFKAGFPVGGIAFGNAVGAYQDTVVVGSSGDESCDTGINAIEDNNNCEGSGAVYVFRNGTGGWTREAYIKPAVSITGQLFADSLDFAAETLVVGADRPSNIGFLFHRTGTTWTQTATLSPPSGYAPRNDLGSVATTPDFAVVGDLREPGCDTGVNGDWMNTGCDGAGAVLVYSASAP